MRGYERRIAGVARRLGFEISRISTKGSQLPVEATETDIAAIAALQPFTMTSAGRLWALMNATRYICNEAIPGDFVECGVWRGGSVMAIANELNTQKAHERQIWLYDTFAGMTTPTSRDIEAATGTPAAEMLSSTPTGDGDNVWCIAGRADVERNIMSTGFPRDNFVFVEGDVAETLQHSRPKAIALLRLDTDWYESTRESLEVLYPLLVPGGVCILDDYGHWKGARQAVDEFFSRQTHQPFMMPIDYSGRILIKTKEPYESNNVGSEQVG